MTEDERRQVEDQVLSAVISSITCRSELWATKAYEHFSQGMDFIREQSRKIEPELATSLVKAVTREGQNVPVVQMA